MKSSVCSGLFVEVLYDRTTTTTAVSKYTYSHEVKLIDYPIILSLGSGGRTVRGALLMPEGRQLESLDRHVGITTYC